jgi:hypothetical protein
VARANRTRAAAAATMGTKAVAATTTRVPTASAGRQHCHGYPVPREGELKEDLRRLQRLAEREVLVASGRQPHHQVVLPNSSKHSSILQSHGTLTTRKARRRPTKATTTSRNPTRRSTSSSADYPTDGLRKLPIEKS